MLKFHAQIEKMNFSNVFSFRFLDSNNFIVLNKFILYLYSMLLFYELFGEEWKRR